LPPAASDDEKLRRHLVWRALCVLESFLCEILGRPLGVRFRPREGQSALTGVETTTLSEYEVQLGDRSSWLWGQFLSQTQWSDHSFPGRFFPSGQIGAGIPDSYFSATFQLGIIASEISSRLFVDDSNQTWHDLQVAMDKLESSLDSWANNLPEELYISKVKQHALDPRAALDLAMHRNNIRMLLYRPCLCEINIESESAKSKAFNSSRARLCVEAALELINLLPDDPIAGRLFQILPWWSLLHYLCQAGTVLLLELCLDLQHFPSEGLRIESGVDKVIGYLSSLCVYSKSAYKAHFVFHLFRDKVLGRLSRDDAATEIREPPIPPTWNQDDTEGFVRLSNALNVALTAFKPEMS
jgi:hypothetical protein